MRAQKSFKMSRTTHRMTKRHIPEDSKPQMVDRWDNYLSHCW